MKNALIPVAVLALAGGQSLRTEYTSERKLRVESVTKVEMETTDFSMERDGEPVESGFGGGGQASSEERRVAWVDELRETAEGRPTLVLRRFEAAEVETELEFGQDSRQDSRESPLADTALELSLDGEGDVVARVAEGSEPDDESVLAGHHLGLFVDALLPAGEVAQGEEWKLDGAAIVTGLGLDCELFPRPEPPDGEGDRGGGRGRRGGFGGFGGPQVRLFALGEWEGKAVYAGEEAGEGGKLAVIALELEASGDMPEPERREGGRRGGFLAAPPARAARGLESTFRIELEGKLLYSLAEKRPVLLEIFGTIATERNIERSFEDTTMTIHSAQEGEFTLRVEIGVE